MGLLALQYMGTKNLVVQALELEKELKKAVDPQVDWSDNSV
jgi:hypothetical protein